MFDGVDPLFMLDITFENSGNVVSGDDTGYQTLCDNDPLFNQQWGLNKINACQAWDIALGDNIKVAVIDGTGIDFNNNDLMSNIMPQSFNYYTNTQQSSPSIIIGNSSHATHMSGIIAANKDNNLQIAGVAPKSKLYSFSVSTIGIHTLNNPYFGGGNSVINYANAINNAVDVGADILNCAWGLDYVTDGQLQLYSYLIEDAINYALTNGRNGKGCVVVFATGNFNSETGSYPGNIFPEILTVGNINNNNIRSYTDPTHGSNYGSYLDVVAPGTHIISTVLNNETNFDSGTSMAAPHVCGIAALILSVNPCLLGSQVRQIIESTTQKLGGYSYQITSNRPNGTWNEEVGYGVVDAFAAVQLAQQISSSNLDLYIKDTYTDLGIEPDSSNVLWDSPSIWVRNINDGFTDDTNQTPYYNPFSPNYVYVKVHNGKCQTSLGTEQVKLYYSLPTSIESPNDSTFRSTFVSNTKSELVLIDAKTIPILQGGNDAILEFEWNFPDPSGLISCTDNSFNTFLLAKIIASNDLNHLPETNNLFQNIKNNNNIAAKDVVPIDNLSFSSSIPGSEINSCFTVDNPFDEIKSFSIEMIKEESEIGKPIYNEAEVKFKMDEILYNAWIKGGEEVDNADSTSDTKLKKVNNNNVLINNILLEPNESGDLQFYFNFLIKELTGKTEYKYHIIQREISSNEIVGGLTFLIKKNQRGIFEANCGGIKEVNRFEPITLSASDINEPAIYNWYDSNGNLIQSCKDLNVSTDIEKKYKLEVVSTIDGFKDYADVNVILKPSSLGIISPNPIIDFANISYKLNETGSGYLMIIGGYGTTNTINNYILNNDETSINIDLKNYSSGFYTVVLISNGKVINSKTLFKE